MALMMALGVGQLFQEARADSAAAKLKVSVTPPSSAMASQEMRSLNWSPEMVRWRRGDMIPADVRMPGERPLDPEFAYGRKFSVEKFEIKERRHLCTH